jgi:cobaltochelatase CobN
MHLLAADAKRIDDGEGAVELGQSPGDIVFLSMADTELAGLAAAARRLPRGGPVFRLANPARLTHPLSVDLYVERTLRHARLVVVRMMGGVGYWTHGLEALRALARAGGPRLVVVPGDDRWDAALEDYSTEPAEVCRTFWRYCAEGGPANLLNALRFAAHLIGQGDAPPEPEVLPKAGYLWPGGPSPVSARKGTAGRAVPVIFYRALVQSGDTAPIEALAAALAERGLIALPIFVTSLKDREAETFLDAAFRRDPPAVVINATGFAVSRLGRTHEPTVLDRPGRPVLQLSFSGSSEAAWAGSPRGLSARDLVMSVVLPELDGRLFTRTVSLRKRASRTR